MTSRHSVEWRNSHPRTGIRRWLSPAVFLCPALLSASLPWFSVAGGAGTRAADFGGEDATTSRTQPEHRAEPGASVSGGSCSQRCERGTGAGVEAARLEHIFFSQRCMYREERSGGGVRWRPGAGCCCCCCSGYFFPWSAIVKVSVLIHSVWAPWVLSVWKSGSCCRTLSAPLWGHRSDVSAPMETRGCLKGPAHRALRGLCLARPKRPLSDRTGAAPRWVCFTFADGHCHHLHHVYTIHWFTAVSLCVLVYLLTGWSKNYQTELQQTGKLEGWSLVSDEGLVR